MDFAFASKRRRTKPRRRLTEKQRQARAEAKQRKKERDAARREKTRQVNSDRKAKYDAKIQVNLDKWKNLREEKKQIKSAMMTAQKEANQQGTKWHSLDRQQKRLYVAVAKDRMKKKMIGKKARRKKTTKKRNRRKSTSRRRKSTSRRRKRATATAASA